MSINENCRTFEIMQATTRLMAEFIYGAGLRNGEPVTVRVRGVGFDDCAITVDPVFA
jgi:site-specific recombinase XerC